MIGLVIVLPVLVQGLPASWQVAVTRYLPPTAGQAITGRTRFTPSAPLLSPWTGFAPFGAYACITLITAAVTLNRRDA